jgi:transposase InsO family protein
MSEHTTGRQRRLFYERHKDGETYDEIARNMGVSRECVRYWCRRQRDGGGVQSRYHKKPKGLLSRFLPIVRFVILRLRLEHPRWGPDRIRHAAQERSSLKGLHLPCLAQIGRYLHQWERFQRKPTQRIQRIRPRQPQRVHECWQMDFKLGIVLQNGRQVNLHTVRDPFGAACIGAIVHDAGKAGRRPRQVTLDQTREKLRCCFAHWNTLPERIQTDNQTGLVEPRQSSDFPTLFTLWLMGLGIEHDLIRSGHPTDNAEVERCHRTVTEYAIIGNQDLSQRRLQQTLDFAVHELNFCLSSKAHGCFGKSPVQAHPELLARPRPFRPDWELVCFNLQRVYAFLASLVWERTVSKVGRIDLGNHRYTVGVKYSRQRITIRFEPYTCEFAFYLEQRFIRRRPALGLSVAELTGLGVPKTSPGPQQLLLPLPELCLLKG